MHQEAQQRHYSTASDSNQWQSRAVIIQGGIRCSCHTLRKQQQICSWLDTNTKTASSQPYWGQCTDARYRGATEGQQSRRAQ